VEKDFDLHHEAANEKEHQLLALEKAIAELPTDQRNCVELFYINQKSYKEITEQTGYDYNKVKSYIQNGKRNLQLKLQNIVVTIILILFYIFK
jgi:RNA polymerase sigma-70 factor (ECF subfamily)